MAFGIDVGEFLGDALDIGKEFIGDITDFVTDIGLEDLASIATTGVALQQLFTADSVDSSTLSAGKASQRGALITSEQGDAPEVQLGAQEEEDANTRSTRAGLRVRRSFDPGTSVGTTFNPLAIQI